MTKTMLHYSILAAKVPGMYTEILAVFLVKNGMFR